MKIILASASPRRRELLSEVCRDFEIRVSDADERVAADIHPRESVRILSERKGRAVFALMSEEEREDFAIISSDTLVELEGEALGKPTSECDAKNMLRRLSGRWHNVHTGIALHVGSRVYSGVATTSVKFKELSDAEIDDYIKSGEPMDKAGSYGIQGLAGKFVSEIDGDFDTVVGLSVRLLRNLAHDAGIDELIFGE